MKNFFVSLTVGFFAIVGCASIPTYTTYREYPINGSLVQLGMPVGDVRSILGTPDNIIKAYNYSTQQIWMYGDHKMGDRKELQIVIEDSLVTKINTYDWK